MWRFNAADERRYDHLIGFTHENSLDDQRPTRARHRRYLLSAASRYCRWRDGVDPRRRAFSGPEAERIEKAMVRNLLPVAIPSDRR
jgi:hypothetical protein